MIQISPYPDVIPLAPASLPDQPPPACLMKSLNFEFLRAKRPELADLGGFAEQYAFSDPVSCLVKLRTYAENLVKAVFARHGLQLSYQSTLNDLLNDSSFKAMTPAVIKEKLHLLRIKGNHAAHGTLYPLPPGKIVDLIHEAYSLGRWFYLFVDGGKMGQLPAWKPLTPDAVDPAGLLQQENKAAQKKLAEQEALMAKLLADLEQTRAQAEATKKSDEETKALLKQAQQAANALQFSEEETRFKLIDEQLAAVGWKVGPHGTSTPKVGQEVEVLHQPNPAGKGYADYVLWNPQTGKPLAVIEAKKTSKDAEQGKMQAQHYADGLEKMHGQRPVIFYTNGYEIFVWDDAKNEPPRSLFGFYSRDSLQYCLFQTKERQAQLAALNPKEAIVDRMYQIEAIKRVAENFDKRRRKALIIQATGTGKTRVAIALCELMVRAGWAKRILFLCDRKELRKQAGDTFDDYLPSEPRVIVKADTGSDRQKRIYLATYPAMMKCFQNFDVGFFDLIIADESHRSIYNRYRDLFRYFDAYQVGLTATPVKFVFRNTYRLFECETEDPTFNYTYEEAIRHDPPYLCPMKVIKHTTKFLRGGIKYKELTKAQQEELDDQVEDPELVDFEKEQVSHKVFNKDTDRKILQNLMEKGIRTGDGTRLGKTIIFARNHAHAKQLVALFQEEFPQYGGDFCVRIDNYEPRAEQLIDDFKSTDGSKNLTIAVSVDMLDTGIDVPAIVNLVFAKPVKSYAKFWQMIGRGTRLCPDLFGPGKDKRFFQIFDHWGNFEYFDEPKKEEEPSQPVSLIERLFEARIKLGEAAISAQDPAALKLSTQLLVQDIAALPEDCLCVREKWRAVRAMQNPGVLDKFEPATVATLRREIVPLMRWRDARGGSEAAYQFDLLIAKLQESRLTKSAAAMDLRDAIINQVLELPINLTQVEEKLEFINKAKATAFYEGATINDLESLRTELRGIMRFRKVKIIPTTKPLVLDVREDSAGIEYKPHHPTLEGLELAHYRHRVEGVLRSLLDQSTALKKIRAGLPVAPEDLAELTDDVLLQDPNLHLEELLIHYPNKSNRIELAIRQIIGMDAARVDEHFKKFIQKYPQLNANQIRFLQLLKSCIAKYGAIEIDQLWEQPFTSIHTGGVTSVFTDGKQVDALLDLLVELNQDEPAA